MTRFSLALLLLLGAAPAKTTTPPKPPPTSTMPSKRPLAPEIGENLWKQSCWQCHGEDGKGDGPAAANLIGGVPSLKGKIDEDRFDSLVTVIQTGKGSMPAFSETIERQDSRRILVYLKDRMAGKPKTKPKTEKDDGAEKPENNAPEGAGEGEGNAGE